MNRHTKRFLRGIGAAILGVLALTSAACAGGGSATSAESTATSKVTVAVLGPGSLQWLHAVAKDQGFYADHGVEVEDIQTQNSGNLVQAVSSGSANAGIALGDNVIKAVDEGAAIKITGALIQKPALRLYGGKGVTDVSQLEGKQVTAGAVKGGTYDLLLYMLQEKGIDTSTLIPTALANSSDRVTAMQNGQVAGALLIPPFDTLAEQNGATMLDWLDEYWLETPAIVNSDWASKNPESARGFTQGLEDAARFFADPANKDAVVKSLVSYTKVDQSAAEAAYTFISDNEIFSPDLSVPTGALKNIARISAEVNRTTLGDFDESKYFDTQYLE